MKTGSPFESRQGIAIWTILMFICFCGIFLFYFTFSGIMEGVLLYLTFLGMVLSEVAVPFSLGKYFEYLSMHNERKIVKAYLSLLMFLIGISCLILLLVYVTWTSLQNLFCITEDSFKTCLYLLSFSFLFQNIVGVHRAMEIGVHRYKNYKKTMNFEHFLGAGMTLAFTVYTVCTHAENVWIVYGYCLSCLLPSLFLAIWYLYQNREVFQYHFSKVKLPSGKALLLMGLACIKYLLPFFPFLSDILFLNKFEETARGAFLCISLFSYTPYICIYPFLYSLLEKLETSYALKDGDRMERQINQSFVQMGCWLFPIAVYIGLHGNTFGFLFLKGSSVSLFSEGMYLWALRCIGVTTLLVSSAIVYAIRQEQSVLNYVLLGACIQVAACCIPSDMTMQYVLSIEVVVSAVITFLNFARLRNLARTTFGFFLKRCLRIALVCCAMHGVVFGLAEIGITGEQTDSFVCLWQNLARIAAAGCITYVGLDCTSLIRKRRVK